MSLSFLKALPLTLFLLAPHRLAASDARQNPGVGFKNLSEEVRTRRAEGTPVELHDALGSYTLHVHSEKIRPAVKPEYTPDDLKQLRKNLLPATSVRVHEDGLVQAADRPLNSLDDPTNYDAVWLRDTLWVALGLRAGGEVQTSNRVLLKMLDDMSTPDQLQRFKSMIIDPAQMKGTDGPMKAVHIRFLPAGRKAQNWNHKQNDALGLFLDLVLRAVLDETLSVKNLGERHFQALASLPVYFSKIRFDEMEDAGSWEEIERVNTSSIGLVTSGLERLRELLKSPKPPARDFARRLALASKAAGWSQEWSDAALDQQISRGYSRIRQQLAAGGESPLYPEGDRRRRGPDAALLNLIYPASLAGLSPAELESIFKIIEPLIGEIGIRRYGGDSYQSGNFWFLPAETGNAGSKTGDTSSAEDFVARGKALIPGTEAQWFFDSWYSKAAGILHRRSGNPRYRALQFRFLNRSLAQITGGSPEKPLSGADGRPVAPQSLPESYNTIVVGKVSRFCPSPITPLNWAKASLVIAVEDAIISR